MRTAKIILCGILIATIASSCGYSRGSLMHSQVESITLYEPFHNKTRTPHLNRYCMKSVMGAFQREGSLKMLESKDRDKADSQLYAEISQMRLRGVGSTYIGDVDLNNDDKRSRNYRTTMYEISVTLEFIVLVPGQNKPLVSKRKVTGKARFDDLGDFETGRRNAAERACENAVHNMVSAITEAW